MMKLNTKIQGKAIPYDFNNIIRYLELIKDLNIQQWYCSNLEFEAKMLSFNEFRIY